MERARKEEEDMRKLAEKKKAEVAEDRRQRAEQEEKEKQRKENGEGEGKEIVLEAGPSSPQKQKATEEPGNTMAKRPKVSNFLGFRNYTDKLQFNLEEHCDKPTHTPACQSCTQCRWPCVNQPGEKQKATTCLACNLKKIPCQIGSSEEVQLKRKVLKVMTSKTKSASPEPVVWSST